MKINVQSRSGKILVEGGLTLQGQARCSAFPDCVSRHVMHLKAADTLDLRCCNCNAGHR